LYQNIAASLKWRGQCAFVGGPVRGGAGVEMEDSSIDGDSSMESGIMGSLAGIWSKDMSVISNVVNAILGVSVFLVPWGFHMSGTVGGARIVWLLAFC
jgi:hypothetical protein